jgi:hypothetical protein
MALFTLTDISYKKLDSSGWIDNPNNKSLNEYGPNLLRYPSDLGNTDKGHYMMIHVHVQDKTSYQANYDGDNPSSQIQKNREGLRAQTGAINVGGGASLIVDKLASIGASLRYGTTAFSEQSTILAKQDEGFFADDIASKLDKLSPTVANAARGLLSAIGKLDNSNFLRTTKRTTDSIALYMPDTLAFTDNQNFNQLELGGELATLATAGAAVVSDSMSGEKFDANALAKNATPFVANFLGKALGGIIGQNSTTSLFATLFGAVKNPQLELLYSTPEFRSFAFEFMFYPRSEKEAEEVQKIVQRLRFHQAPEILTGSAGYFMVPPSEFDIEFYYNGEVNPNIPKISTCALTSISIDYAPNGYRAYEVPGQISPKIGSTGMPVAMRVNLSFRELEIMTKFNYQDETNRAKTREL